MQNTLLRRVFAGLRGRSIGVYTIRVDGRAVLAVVQGAPEPEQAQFRIIRRVQFMCTVDLGFAKLQERCDHDKADP